ncbi:eukaryotic translation initiation factor 3 subunit J [Gilbertella persicaria]|uniref:eukaryotic translation initiation factor 3 subunit J n=1 Tax=Gilbertella persicaria TaxID=101096 RepID=UPI00221F20DD|nr:eukaryotic translation initiation factor 3 subunit J [Gilbertella persicaria]KAI8072213.1 eukaryotic translation initiation factor 3 subunit J [Gilbertella persicaria]
MIEEEFDNDVVVNSKPKMAWDDEEDSDDNTNNVRESWDDSEEEEEQVPKKAEEKKTEAAKAPVKKNLTLKQKIAEKEALLKEQKAKKIALASRFMEGETEEERFERAQQEAGVKKAEFTGLEADAPKKVPAKPVESVKPRTRADFEEFKKLLTDLILQQKDHPNYATFLDQFAKDVAQPMKDMDVRKAASSLTALANDKQRQQKEALKSNKKTKGKTQPAKPAPASSREYSTTYDDFDDFM